MSDLILPAVRLVHDVDWGEVLRREKVQAWYHVPGTGLEPGAFSRQDGESGPSGGDLVVVKRSLWIAAQRGDAVARELVGHELSHCNVRFGPDGQPRADDLDKYSHPATAWAALRHAVRTGLKTNAFTRLLRWRWLPEIRSLTDQFLERYRGA